MGSFGVAERASKELLEAMAAETDAAEQRAALCEKEVARALKAKADPEEVERSREKLRRAEAQVDECKVCHTRVQPATGRTGAFRRRISAR